MFKFHFLSDWNGGEVTACSQSGYLLDANRKLTLNISGNSFSPPPNNLTGTSYVWSDHQIVPLRFLSFGSSGCSLDFASWNTVILNDYLV